MLLQGDGGVARADVVEELFAVLADEGLLVVAGDVVPLDAVVVEVVEDGQAGLALVVLAVVRLLLAVAAGGRPVGGLTVGRRRDLGLGTGPEPAVDDDRLQIGAVAAVKVALATAGPDVLDSDCRNTQRERERERERSSAIPSTR